MQRLARRLVTCANLNLCVRFLQAWKALIACLGFQLRYRFQALAFATAHIEQDGSSVNAVLCWREIIDLSAESEAKRPPIPTEGGHRFRSKATTQSDEGGHPVDRVRRGALSAI